jgi:hypothetical protein
MTEPKPFASLSTALLARKGAAKPAMRSQLTPLDSRAHEAQDDLGWNDMGHDVQAHEAGHQGAEIVAIVPEIVRQQNAMASRVAGAARGAPRSALADGRRAAFTLRVDAERHLKLRLACTIANRSAQQLVTDALDRLLEDLPELSTLAAQVAAQR